VAPLPQNGSSTVPPSSTANWISDDVNAYPLTNNSLFAGE
jgi:hypothetical protein